MFKKLIYQNELVKACFEHDTAYGDFKDLPRRTASDKLLRDKTLNIGNIPKYNRCQRSLASKVCIFLDKKSSGDAVTRTRSEILVTPEKSAINSEIMSNKQLAG